MTMIDEKNPAGKSHKLVVSDGSVFYLTAQQFNWLNSDGRTRSDDPMFALNNTLVSKSAILYVEEMVTEEAPMPEGPVEEKKSSPEPKKEEKAEKPEHPKEEELLELADGTKVSKREVLEDADKPNAERKYQFNAEKKRWERRNSHA